MYFLYSPCVFWRCRASIFLKTSRSINSHTARNKISAISDITASDSGTVNE
ncbi:hypothetical protein GTS53_001677 [Salmonella enterica]|nr:hypothetical protein [Salmonella enterica]